MARRQTDLAAHAFAEPVSKFIIEINILRVGNICHSGTQTAGINSCRNPVKTLIYWMPGQARHDETAGIVQHFQF